MNDGDLNRGGLGRFPVNILRKRFGIIGEQLSGWEGGLRLNLTRRSQMSESLTAEVPPG